VVAGEGDARLLVKEVCSHHGKKENIVVVARMGVHNVLWKRKKMAG
jgi:hypothetical protein